MTVMRRRNELLTASFHRQGDHAKASRIDDCGRFLVLAKMTDTGKRKLVHANYCKERLCKICTHHKSMKVFSEVSNVMNYIQTSGEVYRPVFLTLTLPNCQAEELSLVLDKMFKGFNRLMANVQQKGFILGWFRALEITYNRRRDDFHPHFHIIMLMRPEYSKSKNFLTTEKWVQKWKKALRINSEHLICDIREIKGDKNKAVAEVSKYSVKDTDYLFKNSQVLTDKITKTFSTVLKSRRLYAFGGYMKDVHKLLQSENKKVIDSENNFEIRDESGKILRQDIDYILETFKWVVGISEYQIIPNF